MRSEEEIRRVRENGEIVLDWMRKTDQDPFAVDRLSEALGTLDWVLGG